MELFNLLRRHWDRLTALILATVGAIMLISGWVGVSGTNVLSEQSPYIVSGGLGGIFLLGVSATLWISADLRDEWRKLDRIEKALGEGVLRWDGGPAGSVTLEMIAPAVNGTRARAAASADA